MRLTCPACGAAYDVSDDAIPAAGREVECSDCGAVWQAGGRGAPAGRTAGGARVTDDRFAVERALARAVATGAPASATPVAEAGAKDEPDGDTVAPDEDEGAPPLPGFDPPPKRRPLDDSILRILREEAERETRARAAERTPVEFQPDLGLPEAPSRRPAPPPPTAKTPSSPATSARSTSPPAAPSQGAPHQAKPPQPEVTRKSRFGTGFLLAVGLAAAALYLYVAAPGIVVEFPALAPTLAAYVEAVDGLRHWLAGAVDAVRGALEV